MSVFFKERTFADPKIWIKDLKDKVKVTGDAWFQTLKHAVYGEAEKKWHVQKKGASQRYMYPASKSSSF